MAPTARAAEGCKIGLNRGVPGDGRLAYYGIHLVDGVELMARTPNSGEQDVCGYNDHCSPSEAQSRGQDRVKAIRKESTRTS